MMDKAQAITALGRKAELVGAIRELEWVLRNHNTKDWRTKAFKRMEALTKEYEGFN